MKKFTGFERGMGIGGWLTNYKRFAVVPPDRRKDLTKGDMEHFQTYITEKDVRYIAELGFDHIRLGFDQIVLQREDGTFREEIFAKIDDFISWCEKYGLNVVLNLHKVVGNYCDIEESVSLLDDETLQQGFVDFWIAFEKRYAKKPRVAFELLNEVLDVAPEKWNDLAERTLRAIRTFDEKRIIVIGSTCWNACEKLEYLRLYDDENVVYTFHMYSPMEFTHQRGVLNINTCYYNREMPYPCVDVERYRDYYRTLFANEDAYKGYDEIGEKYIRDCLAPAARFIENHPDKILWCGEFGTIRHIKLQDRIAWFKDVIRFLKDHDIPYSVWNYLSTPNDGNRFSLVNDDERKILSEPLKNVLLGNF